MLVRVRERESVHDMYLSIVRNAENFLVFYKPFFLSVSLNSCVVNVLVVERVLELNLGKGLFFLLL